MTLNEESAVILALQLRIMEMERNQESCKQHFIDGVDFWNNEIQTLKSALDKINRARFDL